jgi:beta-phosphoglucomutase-like phosphatase (HAD superfamily)
VPRHLDASRSFTAVILDMDGLMLDTEAVEFRSWQRAAADLGWSITGEQYVQLIGLTDRDSRAMLTAWFAERPASGGSLADIARRAARYRGEEKVLVKDGLLDLLGWAARERVPVAVASSSTRGTVTARLRNHGLSQAVTAIAGGDEVTHGKPAPDIFLLAARRLGHEPAACVVAEDSDNGIRGAAAAGMTPFLVPDSSIPRAVPAQVRALAYRICGSLTELLGILSTAPVTGDAR